MMISRKEMLVRWGVAMKSRMATFVQKQFMIQL
jgi:hypothetical protein